MQVSFGIFSKRRNSTKRPTTELSDVRDVKLKQNTSLDAPTFVLTGNNFTYNYAQYGIRYYFITDIRSVHENLCEIDCVLDPLATGKDYILNSTQYVCYSSHNSNTWLADNRIPVLNATKTSVSSVLTGILSTIGCYILNVVGKNGCVSYITNTESTIASVLSAISSWESQGIQDAINNISTYSPSYERTNYRVVQSQSTVEASLQEGFQTLVDTIVGAGEELGHTMTNVMDAANTILASAESAAVETGFVGNAYSNAPSCIRSCIWVPFDFALMPGMSGGGSTVYLGNFDTGVAMAAVSAKAVTGSVSVSIPWHYSDWRRSVCEDVYLYLPLVGTVQLSGDSLTHVSSLTIDWSATYTDGVICYKVRAGSEIIGSYGGQCAANYPIGIAQQASAGEIANTIISGLQKTVSGLINSTLSPVSAGTALGNIALNTLTTGYEVENVQKSTHVTAVGGVGGGAGIGLGREIQCSTVCHELVMTPSDMQDTMGLPTMLPYPLATLTGYCQCANAHVEAPLMAYELDAIDTYLNSGFFIE